MSNKRLTSTKDLSTTKKIIFSKRGRKPLNKKPVKKDMSLYVNKLQPQLHLTDEFYNDVLYEVNPIIYKSRGTKRSQTSVAPKRSQLWLFNDCWRCYNPIGMAIKQCRADIFPESPNNYIFRSILLESKVKLSEDRVEKVWRALIKVQTMWTIVYKPRMITWYSWSKSITITQSERASIMNGKLNEYWYSANTVFLLNNILDKYWASWFIDWLKEQVTDIIQPIADKIKPYMFVRRKYDHFKGYVLSNWARESVQQYLIDQHMIKYPSHTIEQATQLNQVESVYKSTDDNDTALYYNDWWYLINVLTWEDAPVIIGRRKRTVSAPYKQRDAFNKLHMYHYTNTGYSTPHEEWETIEQYATRLLEQSYTTTLNKSNPKVYKKYWAVI